MHIKKERFLEQRRSKLITWGDGPFQIIKRINDNVYKVNLLGEYDISATFNIFFISLFCVEDNSRMNPLNERRNDIIQATPTNSLEVLIGFMTRLRTKRFKKVLNRFLQDKWVKMDFKKNIK